MSARYTQMQDSLFNVVRLAGPSGIRPADAIRKLVKLHPEEGTPHVRTVTRWMREDARMWRPTGHGYYAVRRESR